MIAWRNTKGKISMVADKCPHRGMALIIGKLAGGCIQYPFLGFEYDSSGTCKLVPVNGREADPPKALILRSFPAREEHGLVNILWGEPREYYP